MNGFRDIVGHDKIIEHLQNSIQLQKISHAYILHGEDGAGKNRIASAFAAALQCEAGGIEPCGACTSCLQANSCNHPDIIRIVHEKSKIGVDDIRTQLNHDIQVKPYSSAYKIYIIDEAEKLTEQAQNALLKTIEEPPQYAVILLLTNNRNLFLPTILSRCITLDLKPVNLELIKEYLMEKQAVPDYFAELSAVFSGGNLGKAIQYASSEHFIEVRDDSVHILKYIDDMKFEEVMDALKHFSEQKADIDDYLDIMMLWYRDILMFKATKNVNRLIFRDEVSDIRKQADIRSFEDLNEIVLAFEKARVRLKANVNLEVAMEMLLLTIREGKL